MEAMVRAQDESHSSLLASREATMDLTRFSKSLLERPSVVKEVPFFLLKQDHVDAGKSMVARFRPLTFKR
jgi:hypothetical protein